VSPRPETPLGRASAEAPASDWGRTPFSLDVVERMRRTRRHPRRTQFDYLHVRRLVDDLATVLSRVGRGAEDVLDVFCGTRPYDDLLPAGARVLGLDIAGNPYGVADVVSDEFLPFDDASFDLVMCIEGFHYVVEPEHGVAEVARVLRPGGHAVVSVPFVWEYDRSVLENRYTGPALARLFAGWEDVVVVENGGRAISWATLTGLIVSMGEHHVPERFQLRRLAHPAFAALYLGINGLGFLLDRTEQRFAQSSLTLPMNLLLVARRPAGAVRA
jgi:SAM-dependent methyltransferase